MAHDREQATAVGMAPEGAILDPERLRALKRFHFGVSSATDSNHPERRFAPLFAPAPPDAPEPLAEAPVRLLLEQATPLYTQAWQRWRSDTTPLVSSLESMLGSPADGEDVALSGALGGLGSRFVDAAALAERLHSQRAAPLEEGRRQRIQHSLELLKSGLRGSMTRRPLVVCEPSLEGLAIELPDGVEVEVDQHPCEAAALSFDSSAAEVSRLLAAVRIARLELEHLYDPDQHDLALERFDWRALHIDERPLLPTIVCLLSHERAVRDQLSSLFQLLSWGRPIQVVIPVDPLAIALEGAGGGSFGGALDLGHLALSHRRCLVHQGSTASHSTLEQAFERSLSAPGMALHLLAGCDDPSSAWPSLVSRCHPSFVFDPSRPGGAALELSGNPAPAQDWVDSQVEVRTLDLDGGNGSGKEEPVEVSGKHLDGAFTPAELALCSESFRHELEWLGDDPVSEGLVPLTEWLSLDSEQARHELPFIWGRDEGNVAQQLVVSRRLALACLERLDHWQTLRRLHGDEVQRSEAALPLGVVPTSAAQELSEASESAERKRMAEQVVHRLMAQLLAERAPSEETP